MSDINSNKSENEKTDSKDMKKQTSSNANKEATEASKPKKEESKKDSSDITKNSKTDKEEKVSQQSEAQKDVPEPKDEEEVAKELFAQKDEEEIKQELENIKDIMQEEVDKIVENPETNDWNELVKNAHQEIKDAKKVNEESNNIDEEDLCEACGKRVRDTSVSEDNPYCKECREKMKKSSFSIAEIVTPILVIALIFLASWQLALEWGTFKDVAQAEALVKDCKLYSAVEKYDSVNTQFKVNNKPMGKKILNNQVELFDKIGMEYYDITQEFINKYYSGQNLDSHSNRKVKETMTTIEDFGNVYQVAAQAFQGVEDYKSFVKNFDKALKEDKDKVYDKGLIEYWKYNAARMFGEDEKVQIAHLKKMEKESPRYSSIYLPSIAEVSLNMHDYDNMFKYCDKLDSVNVENMYTKIYRATAYRLKGDLNKAEKIINNALKESPIDANFNYQMSIIKLLKNKPKEAFKYAKTAYENSEQYSYIPNANLYALCAHMCNDTKTYTQLEERLGDQLSKDVIDIIEGSKTVEDVFQKGEGDITWN